MAGVIVRGRAEPLRVLHLDHSRARGGAEYALLRMLVLPSPWKAEVFLPRVGGHDTGVFDTLGGVRGVTVRAVGPAQYSGASARSGVRALLGFALRAVGQSASIRLSASFRRSHVIHANTSRAAAYGAAACLASRKKLVVHLRDFTSRESLGGVGFTLFTRLALRRADGVIGNSQATLDTALPYIRPGVATAVIASAAGIVDRQVPDAQPAALERIGMVARIDPWKGQDLLLKAFAAVFGGTNVRLQLAGSAPFGNEFFAAELHTLAGELGVSGQVDFLGHVDDVDALLDTWQIAVQSALRPEPLGQNVLQYLARGRAVVAANAGGPTEWITSGTNGLLFEPGDVDSLAGALRALCEDSALRSSIAAAAAVTPNLMTDAEIAEEHRRFFLQVAGGDR